MSVNSTPITVVGRIVSEISTRLIPAGVKVANFRLLSLERNFDKTTQTWVDGDRMYMTIACWRALADHVVESLRKGDQVVVHGRLKIHEYRTDDGDRRSNIEVDARAVGPDLTLHTVTVNRPDWATSPGQHSLLAPPQLEPVDAELEPVDQEKEVAQAA